MIHGRGDPLFWSLLLQLEVFSRRPFEVNGIMGALTDFRRRFRLFDELVLVLHRASSRQFHHERFVVVGTRGTENAVGKFLSLLSNQ